MSFGGHVADMINRMKSNRALRPSNRKKDKPHKTGNAGKSHEESSPLRFKNVSRDELEEIKSSIRQRARARRNQNRALAVFLFLIGIGVGIWMILKLF
jgi:hypothetical protein